MNETVEKTMFITVDDYHRITGSPEFASLKSKNPAIADRLLKELKHARTFSQSGIAPNIVTMNSCVLLKELNSGRETKITVTYPQEADIRRNKVSVFSPVGVALLGCREGDIASWSIPGGIGRFKLVKVIYQPEAAGDFSL